MALWHHSIFTMSSKVTEYWTSDRSTIFVHGNRYQRLTAEAVRSAAQKGNVGAEDVIERYGEDFGGESFDRGYSVAVLGALVTHAADCGPIGRHRINQLTTDLVVAAEKEFVPNSDTSQALSGNTER